MLTLVVCRTVLSREKSLTPDSSMLMEESRSCMLDLREETQPCNVLFDDIVRLSAQRASDFAWSEQSRANCVIPQ